MDAISVAGDAFAVVVLSVHAQKLARLLLQARGSPWPPGDKGDAIVMFSLQQKKLEYPHLDLEGPVTHGRFCTAVLTSWTFALILMSNVAAQEGTPGRPLGIPQDWTQRHLIFSMKGLQSHPEVLQKEPRIGFQAIQRWQPSRPLTSVSAFLNASDPDRDWNVALGGRLAANAYPAKYGLDPTVPPSCATDFVAFGLNVGGITGGRPNFVAFNNIYSGTGGICGAAPTVYFAYNVTKLASGRVATSPLISIDGKKIAFVETNAGSASFHVLTWATGAGNGTLTAAAVPGTGNTASLTSLAYSPAAADTRSSPWLDYNTDIAYVGADDGRIYKITGVFRGTPTLAGSPWPVTLSPGFRLTSPVLDNARGLLFVGSQNGTLYSVNITTGAVRSLVVGRSGATNAGIIAAPSVDVTNGTVFVVSSNDGTSGVFVEADTATMTQLVKARIGLASKSGTPINLYQPAFDNNYFNNPSAGVVRLCGTGASDITPWQYGFGFTGRLMKATPVFSKQLLTSTTARCTGWTELFNPNIGTGGTDFFFFGLTADCTGTGTSGCVVARTNDTSLVTAPVAGGPSGIVVDNFSLVGQASSIYFTGLSTPNTAYKFTQNGLR